MIKKDKFSILYVDDEPSNLRTFKGTFRREYNVFTAESGKDGIQILKDENIDVIFSDQRMPEMTGVEFLTYAYEKYPDLKRILITGFSDFESIKQAINLAKISEYIQKPWKEEALKEIIKRSLRVNVLEKEKAEITRLKEVVEKAHNDITASVIYAKTIQEALLTNKDYFKNLFPNSFILYKPKDIVSGDFYYANKINNHLIFTVGDCTGHGVPGGFITMLAITYLHEIVGRENTVIASEILTKLRNRITGIFKAFDSDNQNGLDISLCSIDLETNIMHYAGAYNPLWLVRNNELTEYKATRSPIGFFIAEKEFANTEIQLQNDDIIYLGSDGFQDQPGGEFSKKFYGKNLKELLLKNHTLEFEKQKNELENTFETWKGDFPQVDDITVMGVKWKM